MLDRLRPRLTYANVISTLCLFIVLGGAAFAATSFIQANGTIRGCVSKKGQLTVLKNGKSKCRKGQTAISWNQVGKQGPPGQQGAKGDTGPATGPAGGDLQGNYPNPTIKPNVVSGANIDESTLGQVPSAATAANSSQLGGLAPSAFFRSSNVLKIDALVQEQVDGFSESDVLDLSGLHVSVRCTRDQTSGEQTITVFASNAIGNAGVGVESVHGNPGSATQTESALVPAPGPIFTRVTTGVGETGNGAFVFRDDTQVVTIPFRYLVSYVGQKCELWGTATRAGP